MINLNQKYSLNYVYNFSYENFKIAPLQNLNDSTVFDKSYITWCIELTD